MSATDEDAVLIKQEDLDDTDHSFSVKQDSTDDEYSVIFKKKPVDRKENFPKVIKEEPIDDKEDIPKVVKEEPISNEEVIAQVIKEEPIEDEGNISTVILNELPVTDDNEEPIGGVRIKPRPRRSAVEDIGIESMPLSPVERNVTAAVEPNDIESEPTSPVKSNGSNSESPPPSQERTLLRHSGLTPELQHLNISPAERVLCAAVLITLIFSHLDYKTLITTIPLVCHQFHSIIEHAKEGNGPLAANLFSEKFNENDNILMKKRKQQELQELQKQQKQPKDYSSNLQYPFTRPYPIDLSEIKIHPAFEHIYIDLSICLKRNITVDDIYLLRSSTTDEDKRIPLLSNLPTIAFQNATQPALNSIQVHITFPYPGFYDIGGTATTNNVISVMCKFIDVVNKIRHDDGYKSYVFKTGKQKLFGKVEVGRAVFRNSRRFVWFGDGSLPSGLQREDYGVEVAVQFTLAENLSSGDKDKEMEEGEERDAVRG